jgi:hypothetical protein
VFGLQGHEKKKPRLWGLLVVYLGWSGGHKFRITVSRCQ